jgi:hypothetical protein
MKKKSVEMRALEMACIADPICNNCPLYSLPCRSKWNRDTRKNRVHCGEKRIAHFLSLAKKEMDKEKK